MLLAAHIRRGMGKGGRKLAVASSPGPSRAGCPSAPNCRVGAVGVQRQKWMPCGMEALPGGARSNVASQRAASASSSRSALRASRPIQASKSLTIRSGRPLEYRRDALSAANAHRLQPVANFAPVHFVRHVGEDAAPGCADRVAQ